MSQPIVNRICFLEKFPGKGGWTYALIPEIKPDPHAWFGWISVRGRIDDIELPRCKLMPKGDGQLFLPVNAAMRKKLKKQAGDEVHITLFTDNDPPQIPDELMACFELEQPETLTRFRNLPIDYQHTAIKRIFDAKQPDTRARRILELFDELE
jgi:hypothetical protein